MQTVNIINMEINKKRKKKQKKRRKMKTSFI